MNEFSDKFLNDELNDADRKKLDSLFENTEFMETTYLNLLLKKSFEEEDNLQFLRTLKEVEQIHYYEQTYSLEELLAFFAPVQEYEENLLTISRASDVEVLHPKNYINCTDNLQFEWKSPNEVSLLLIVENNEYDVLIRKEIPSQTLSFGLQLSFQKGFKPGRYYWKLASKRHQVSAMGVFFIGKGLMQQK
ncbi:MAG: hypothetical protein AB8B69_07195 [Chitinophagales bacterium]